MNIKAYMMQMLALPLQLSSSYDTYSNKVRSGLRMKQPAKNGRKKAKIRRKAAARSRRINRK